MFPLRCLFVTLSFSLMSLRSARCHYHLSGPWYSPYGQEECHCQKPALCGDPGLHLRHLLRQNWHPHHQPDVCDQGGFLTNEEKCTLDSFHELSFMCKNCLCFLPCRCLLSRLLMGTTLTSMPLISLAPSIPQRARCKLAFIAMYRCSV